MQPLTIDTGKQQRCMGILKRDGETIKMFVSDDITEKEGIEVRRTDVCNLCWMHLQNIQPASCDHALKYEGYAIEVD